VEKCRSCWIALVLFVVAAPQAFAQSSVDARVQRLEENIQVLGRRVGALEAQLREQKTLAPVASDKVPWRKLKKGMSKEEVEQLLGSPSDVSEYGSFTVWRYQSPSGGIGTVRFSANSRAEGWNEP